MNKVVVKERTSHRRAGVVVALATLLAACSPVPVAPTTWLRLSAEPALSTAPGETPAVASRDVWQLMRPVVVPTHLERDSLFVPQGASGAVVRPLAGARWIEPLQDALPRLLREDLARELRRRFGVQALWQAPLPAGLAPTRRLRVEIAAFEGDARGQALLIRARWSIADADGGRPPAVHEARFTTPPASMPADAEGWAAAHRQAVWMLAARIAATMAP